MSASWKLGILGRCLCETGLGSLFITALPLFVFFFLRIVCVRVMKSVIYWTRIAGHFNARCGTSTSQVAETSLAISLPSETKPSGVSRRLVYNRLERLWKWLRIARLWIMRFRLKTVAWRKARHCKTQLFKLQYFRTWRTDLKQQNCKIPFQRCDSQNMKEMARPSILWDEAFWARTFSILIKHGMEV